MKSLLVLPLFLTVIIAAATQLEAIAQETSDKAVAFSQDMNDAMDCAVRGIPIGACSPDLYSYDFDPEKEALLDALEELERMENSTELLTSYQHQ